MASKRKNKKIAKKKEKYVDNLTKAAARSNVSKGDVEEIGYQETIHKVGELDEYLEGTPLDELAESEEEAMEQLVEVAEQQRATSNRKGKYKYSPDQLKQMWFDFEDEVAKYNESIVGTLETRRNCTLDNFYTMTPINRKTFERYQNIPAYQEATEWIVRRTRAIIIDKGLSGDKNVSGTVQFLLKNNYKSLDADYKKVSIEEKQLRNERMKIENEALTEAGTENIVKMVFDTAIPGLDPVGE